MCGIAGFVGARDSGELMRMVSAIKHRGPDHSGFLVRNDVALGHARLSIIDTSSGAHQPMVSIDESLAVVFNGEIYNFHELRAELLQGGCIFRTNSDTEVILHLYARDGAACFARMIGMFAIAIFDFKEQQLVLARDRMGEKPLYWANSNGVFVFASEVKSVFASGFIKPIINIRSLQQYLQFDYVPTPMSIFNGVQKLEPASVLIYRDGSISQQTFWAPPSQVVADSQETALNKLDTLFELSVTRQLVSDVPIGVFLSGGLDSSAVAYYAQRASNRPIETFSIGFDEPTFDESAYARRVAAHLGTNHHEHTVQAHDILELVPRLGEALDEPVADASIFPTMLLSQFARQYVTVALGGDGGDELFAGYPTFQAEHAHILYASLPLVVRRFIVYAVQALPASPAHAFSASFALKKFVSGSVDDAAIRHLEWLGTFSMETQNSLLVSCEIEDVLSSVALRADSYVGSDIGNKLLWLYARSYLMDQVLVKVDRASMRYALETRAPFLDHTVVDYVYSLPYEMKYKMGTTKYLLKNLMRDRLPRGIVERKKKGFGIPLAQWLMGPLRPLCEELLSFDRLRTQGIFNAGYVQQLIAAHMERRHDYRKELWNLMVFQLWYDRWIG